MIGLFSFRQLPACAAVPVSFASLPLFYWLAPASFVSSLSHVQSAPLPVRVVLDPDQHGPGPAALLMPCLRQSSRNRPVRPKIHCLSHSWHCCVSSGTFWSCTRFSLPNSRCHTRRRSSRRCLRQALLASTFACVHPLEENTISRCAGDCVRGLLVRWLTLQRRFVSLGCHRSGAQSE